MTDAEVIHDALHELANWEQGYDVTQLQADEGLAALERLVAERDTAIRELSDCRRHAFERRLQ